MIIHESTNSDHSNSNKSQGGINKHGYTSVRRSKASFDKCQR